MANKLASVRQLKPIDPMGKGMLLGSPDNAGGYMYQGSEGGSSNGSKSAGAAKASMIDGPYGGKVKA